MKTDFLKELGLTQMQINKIMAENGKDIEYEKSKTASEHEKLLKANEKVKNLQEYIKKFDGAKIDELKKSKKELEDKYKCDISKMKQEFEEKELNNAIELELIKLGVNSIRAAKAELDLGKITKDKNGKIAGLKEQIALWQTEKKWLLKTSKKQNLYTPQNGEAVDFLDLNSQIY